MVCGVTLSGSSFANYSPSEWPPHVRTVPASRLRRDHRGEDPAVLVVLHGALPLQRFGKGRRYGLLALAGLCLRNEDAAAGEVDLIVADAQYFPVSHGSAQAEHDEKP